ncbi:MAG: hypothetical protein AB7J35_06190 [Dehalococcoidia bacterium]
MEDGSLAELGKALEEEFFQQQNAELVAKLRASHSAGLERDEMVAALGVNSAELVRVLMAAGVTEATIAAVALAPLVLVAWADGKMDPEERKMVLARAEASGVAPGSTEYALLDLWLDHKPPETLERTWSEFARGVLANVESDHRQDFRDAILRRAASVANAAGGFIGHRKVSSSERKMLDDIQSTLAG